MTDMLSMRDERIPTDPDGEVHDSDASASSAPAEPSSSLGQLLLDLTAQVQDERRRRSEVEQRNHALMLETDQLQREVLELRTQAASSNSASNIMRRRHSTTDIATADFGEAYQDEQGGGAPSPSASFFCRELQDTRVAKDRALVESHQRALQVLELSACVSMQHDELSALRSSLAEMQAAHAEGERLRGDCEREKDLLRRELELSNQDVERLTQEVGARGEHVATLMEKWTEAQARSEHLERQQDEAAGKLSAALSRGDEMARQREQLVDERDCLQHQVNHLKGAVAAKSAESRAFQAFGSHARDHVQAQNAALQRHLVLRRSVHARASQALSEVRTLRVQLTRELRAPMLALQADCQRFLTSIRVPVLTLVNNADRYARMAHAEHGPLREALGDAEQARRHLHDQLWRARQDAAIVVQVVQQVDREPEVSGSNPTTSELLVRANFHSGELLMLKKQLVSTGDSSSASRATDTTSSAIRRRVRCEALYSDRSRIWSSHESVSPLVQSLFDGRNACVLTVAGASELVINGQGPTKTTSQAVEVVLAELFRHIPNNPTGMRRARLSLSLLAVFNETVYDLLGLDSDPMSAPIDSQQQANHMVVVEVQALEEALLVLKGARDTLEAAGQRGALSPSLTHTVITVCLTLDDRFAPMPASLTRQNAASGAPIRSKLQLVELALPLDYEEDESDHIGVPVDRERMRERVAATASIRALCIALAGVRLTSDRNRRSPSRNADDAVGFVRFHGSKLTVLLQDTLRAGGKLLTLVTLPARVGAGTSHARVVSAVLRLLEQLRLAVGDSSCSPDRSIAMETMGARDRTLESFMSRLAVNQAQAGASGASADSSTAVLSPSSSMAGLNLDSSSAPLAFTSPAMRENDAFGKTSPWSWEAELDAMTRRYGGKAALDELLVAIQQQQQQQQLTFAPMVSPLPSPTRSLSSPPRSPARSPPFSASAPVLSGGEAGIDFASNSQSDAPHRDSVSTPKSQQLRGSRGYKAGTSSSMRKSRPRLSAGKSQLASNIMGRKMSASGTIGLSRSKSEVVRPVSRPVGRSPVQTLAPRASAPPASVNVRLRRETASSALKKSLVSTKQQDRSPFR